MKCEICHQHEAETVLFRHSDSGKTEELYVCGACATRERAFERQHGIQVAAMDAPPMPGTPPEGMMPPGMPPGMPQGLPPDGMLGPNTHIGRSLPPGMLPPGMRNLPEKMLSQLEDLFGQDSEHPEHFPEDMDPPKTCPLCGMAADDLPMSMHLGCTQCYETFREELKGLFADLQGCTEYKGEPPAWLASQFKRKQLEQALQTAIANEQFALAKRLTQELQALRDATDAEEDGHDR